MEFLKMSLIFLFKKILDFIYPPCCLRCGKKEGKKYLCSRCYKILNLYRIDKSFKYKDKYFNEHLCIFKYEDKVKKLLTDYKFNDKAYLFEIFIIFLLKNKKMCRFFKTYDIITPVPIHKKRKKDRGYNQSAIIAKKIANNFSNLEYLDLLEKRINNKPQSSLNRNERIENVKNVYNAINIRNIKNKNIIVFDDIYTTGSTLNECAKVLKQNGAKNIIVITIAKD